MDPPYNSNASEIMYKNNYKNSSWLSLMKSRLELGKQFLNDDGIQCTTIDDVEQSKLNILLEEVFNARPELLLLESNHQEDLYLMVLQSLMNMVCSVKQMRMLQ